MDRWGLCDELDDSDPLDEADVEDDGRHRFEGNFFPDAMSG